MPSPPATPVGGAADQAFFPTMLGTALLFFIPRQPLAERQGAQLEGAKPD